MKEHKNIRNSLRLNDGMQHDKMGLMLMLALVCALIIAFGFVVPHTALAVGGPCKGAASTGVDLIYGSQQVCTSDQNVPSQAAAPATIEQPVTYNIPARANSASIEAMINSVFGPYAASARRIAMCESGMNPNATNSIAIGGSHAAGLFQILYPSTWKTTSQAGKSPYNAQANINAAHEIFVRDGHSWREWVCAS